MDLNKLTPEERAQLKAQFDAEEQKEKEKLETERENYKKLVSEAVLTDFDQLLQLSIALSTAKGSVFDNFASLIKMKSELYEVKESQRSHTFTSTDGKKRITIGYRIIDRYDDTADAGEAKIKQYIDSLAKDENSAEAVEVINELLKRDKGGNFKPSRVLDLQKMAAKSKNKLFKDGVQVIVDAHKPERSAYFIEAEWKNEVGNWQNLALSISSASFPEGHELNEVPEVEKKVA